MDRVRSRAALRGHRLPDHVPDGQRIDQSQAGRDREGRGGPQVEDQHQGRNQAFGRAEGQARKATRNPVARQLRTPGSREGLRLASRRCQLPRLGRQQGPEVRRRDSRQQQRTRPADVLQGVRLRLLEARHAARTGSLRQRKLEIDLPLCDQLGDEDRRRSTLDVAGPRRLLGAEGHPPTDHRLQRRSRDIRGRDAQTGQGRGSESA